MLRGFTRFPGRNLEVRFKHPSLFMGKVCQVSQGSTPVPSFKTLLRKSEYHEIMKSIKIRQNEVQLCNCGSKLPKSSYRDLHLEASMWTNFFHHTPLHDQLRSATVTVQLDIGIPCMVPEWPGTNGGDMVWQKGL